MNTDYIKMTEIIAKSLVEYYGYDDPSMLGYDIENNFAKELEDQIVSKWDAYDVMMSAGIQSWSDVIDDYGFDLTSIYGVASYVIANLFYTEYYKDVVNQIMSKNGWSDDTDGIDY